MWKEKLGNYLIDISKYTLTAVFIASLFKDLEEMKWIVYGVMLLAMGVPCAIFLLWCLTPLGEKWLKANHMI